MKYHIHLLDIIMKHVLGKHLKIQILKLIIVTRSMVVCHTNLPISFGIGNTIQMIHHGNILCRSVNLLYIYIYRLVHYS